jgi:hypothetical protein
MRTQLLYLLGSILLFSCSVNENKIEGQYKPLSEWLISNEDSLAKQFKVFISKQNLKPESAGQIVSKEWIIDDTTILGALTKKISLIDSNIYFAFEYWPDSIKKYALHLTPNRKRSTSKIIDSLFSDIGSLMNFRIIKYSPPEGESSEWIYEDEKGNQVSIKPTKIGFKFNKYASRKILDCFFTQDLSEEIKENLVYGILGEEVILKKVDSIRYFKTDTIDTSMLSIKTIKQTFNVPN